MVRHDRSYRKLFAHPRMVASLLRDLLGEGLTGPLDLATLERVPDSFLSPRHAARQADLIWRLRRPDGRPLYVLLEFQSDIQRFMPVRVLAYVALLQQELVDRRELAPGDLVPEVLAVVIYNGGRRWRQPVEMSQLVAAGAQPGPHVPRLGFVLVDQGSYPLRRLARLAGPIGAFFLLERCRSVAQLERAVRLLVDRLQEPDDGALRRDFLVWLQIVLLPDRGFDDDQIPALPGLEELRDMLAERVQVWNRQLIEKGRQEGRKEGRQEGEVGIVLRQLEHKFGPLDEGTVERVRAARASQRRAWAKRLLSASTLEEVFG
jgi:predicted transposase YdaD